MGVFYVTREAFKASAGFKGIDSDAAIDRLLESSSRQIESLLHRHFYPIVQTRAYEWPQPFANTSLRLYLDEDLLDVTSILSGDAAFTSYVLQPYNAGPPYTRIEALDDAFEQAAIAQASIVIAGIWGYSNDTAVVGALVAGIDNAVTALVVPDASLVGIGDLIFIGTEAMLVTGRALVATAAVIAAPGVAADASVTSIPVSSGAALHAGEVATVDAEKMFVIGTTTNTLIVKRAYDGSVLAAHLAGAVVYAARTLTVVRGACGTTAAAHLINAAITRNVPPGLVSDWCLAEAVSRFEQEQAGYGRNIGQGEGAIEAKGVGLKDLREQATAAYERRRAVRTI